MPVQETKSNSLNRKQNTDFFSRLVASAIVVIAITLALFPQARTFITKASSSSIPTLLSRTMATTTTQQPLSITLRPSSARGHADHGWLYTFHTFSFASYHSAAHSSFGPLRVINEDRVAAGTGFGTHSHAEFHIWSYIVSGELEHKDSMGNLEVLKRGDVQFTCAGTGISHSEYNRNPDQDNHFLQIWARPSVKGLTPRYVTRHFDDASKTDRLVKLVESRERVEDEGKGPIALEADVGMFASILTPGKKVVHQVVEEGRRNVYLHVVMRGEVSAGVWRCEDQGRQRDAG